MPDLQDFRAVIDLPGEWFLVAADHQEASGALADSPSSMPAFFVGWIGLGVLIGAALGRRGTTAVR